MSTYHFDATSFRNYVWVKGGATFRNPEELSIELTTQGAFRVEVYDGGALAYSYRKKGQRATWTSLYFNGNGVDDYGTPIVPLRGEYQFKLVNEAQGTRKARQGELEYA
ncbi:MAG TPA: hypothetical protein VMG12_10060 [Polyangiaceae bacterium]|nr:hypothetical protein [Polyangiaceae bacterium]